PPPRGEGHGWGSVVGLPPRNSLLPPTRLAGASHRPHKGEGKRARSQVMTTQIVSQAEWLKARQALLAQEKKFTKERDELSRQRRELPWVEVTKAYQFDTPEGRKTFADLFAGKNQLIVYHFMFHPDWTAG